MGHSITDVAGIGLSTATLLSDHGIKSAEALARSSLERLQSIPGFGPVRAQRVLAAAQQVVGELVGKDKKKEKKRKEKVKKSEGKDAKGRKSKDKRRKRRKKSKK